MKRKEENDAFDEEIAGSLGSRRVTPVVRKQNPGDI
jgi:hypothetical protein